MLLALVTISRSLDLYLLDLQFKSSSSEGIIFRVGGLSKTRRSGPPRSVIIKRLPSDLALCPVTTQEAYEQMTKPFRPVLGPSPLFISLRKPRKPVSSSTISRWIKSVMAEAGIDVDKFKPHSIRAASSSAAKASGVPLADIMTLAGWSRSSTFERFRPSHLYLIASALLLRY